MVPTSAALATLLTYAASVRARSGENITQNVTATPKSTGVIDAGAAIVSCAPVTPRHAVRLCECSPSTRQCIKVLVLVLVLVSPTSER